MKKHLLIFASFVLGFGQLFADEVTFKVSDLKASLPANNTNIDLPYTWDGAPAPVTVTIARQDELEGSIGVSTVIPLSKYHKIIVAASGAATLNSIKISTDPANQNGNAEASTGEFYKGKWNALDDTKEVTFNCTNNFRITQIAVDYTLSNTGDDPVTSWTQELTVGIAQSAQIEFTMEGTPKAVSYTTSDAKIATVAANGKVTGVAVGTCTVTTIIDEENGNRWSKETAVTVVQPEAKYVANAATYTGTEPFICDYVTGEIYALNNLGQYEKWGVMEAVNDLESLTTYDGKLAVLNTDNCEYKFVGGKWVNVGSVLPQEIATEANYKNMTYYNEESNPNGGWYCRWGYANTFNRFVYDAETNVNSVNPYEGAGGWEPYQSFKIEGLNPGDTYKVSFKYTGSAWRSWSSYTKLPFYVLNNPDFGSTLYVEEPNNEVLAVALLPNTETTDQEYTLQFVADKDFCVLAVQFGVCDDGSHDPAFAFKFADLKIERVPIVEQYVNNFKLVAFDNNAYTPLAYIESTGASRENAFTLPYIPVTETQISTKFTVYDSSNGWCGIFCARNTHAGTGISLYMNGNKANFGYFTGGTTGSGDNFAPFSVNTEYEVTADVTKLVVNGTEYPTGNTVTNPTSRKLSLFANPEWDNPMRGRINYCTIKEGEETIFDFQPVMRHDGVFGYYDATKKLFVQPARGSYDGYGYGKLEDQTYVTFSKETRIAIVGTTAQFLPEVQNLDGATFTWTTSDESIATVAADGTVTGLSAGKVIITATTDADNGWTASYELTVSEPNYVRRDVNGVGYAIITGGNGWGDSPLSALIDNDATTKFGCSGAGDAWAIIIASEPVAVQQYSFVTGADTYNNPGRTPRNWKLEGSNDNQSWFVIDQQEQNYKVKTSNMEQTVFEVNGTDTYKFFKFTADNFNGGFQLGEFWINAQALNFAEKPEARVEATCTAEGKVVYEDAATHVLYVKPFPATGHFYQDGVCSVCGAKASEPVLLANGQEHDYVAKFRHMIGSENDRNIEEGWNTADFDDSAWDEMVMPLGTAGYGVQHTIWQNEYNTFWFRRNFYVENPAAITKLTLKVLHDDDYAIYVNGTLIDEAGGWTNGTDWVNLDVDPSLLVQGNNVVAMYIEQNWGGAYCDFYLVGNAGATIEVSDAGYATFVAPVDVDFSGNEAITANAVTFDGNYVQLTPVTTVPAYQAVVVKAAEGTYTVPATSDAVLEATNELVAATTDVLTNGNQYVLAKVDETVGFYKASGTIAEGKGYLEINSAVKAFYPFAANDATGINAVEIAEENAPIYNVAGQRIQKMQKGINIVGGKKVLK